MVVIATSALRRSALPNLMPLRAQFAPKGDFGVVRWTITPTKASQPGADLRTVPAIAVSKFASKIKSRSSERDIEIDAAF
jgi:hypothetical protein